MSNKKQRPIEPGKRKRGKNGEGFILRHPGDPDGADYYIDDNGCHIWLRAKAPNGYAQARHLGKTEYVTRLLMKAEKGQEVRHAQGCSKSCINPAHLKLGTKSENMIDRAVDGNNPASKLTDEQVLEIYRRVWNGEKGVDLAREFGVSPSTIWRIKHGITHNHITKHNPGTTYER